MTHGRKIGGPVVFRRFTLREPAEKKGVFGPKDAAPLRGMTTTLEQVVRGHYTSKIKHSKPKFNSFLRTEDQLEKMCGSAGLGGFIYCLRIIHPSLKDFLDLLTMYTILYNIAPPAVNIL